MNYLEYFFNPKHLFSLRPEAMSQRAVIIAIVLFAAMVLAGLVIKFITPKIKDGLRIKAYRRFSHLLITMGLIGFVYLFFAWQGVALLASRFWLLIWLGVILVWGGFILKYLLVDMPKTRKEIENRRRFEKYLP